MFFPKTNLPKKNPNAKLAGGLSRRDTALPERDSTGQTIDYQNQIDELPLVTVPPTSPEFAKQLTAIFRQLVEKCGLKPRSAAEQWRNILSALGIKFRRPPMFDKSAQTPAQRQQRYRERKTDWDWLPFPIISHAGYLVIEASPEEEIPLFDIHRAHIVIGFELQRTMDAHHRDYPDQKPPADQPEQHGTEFETELSGVKVLVLQYPDKFLYIAAAYETPPAIGDVLAAKGFSSLNRGLFMAEAPKGKGKVISGWRHRKGYDTDTSGFDPGLDATGDTSDFYADEFATEDDDNSPSDNPGSQPESEFKAEEVSPYAFVRRDLDETVEKYRQDEERDEGDEQDTDVLKCKICQEVLEGDDSTLLFKHLEERHLDEYQRIGRAMEKQFEKARESEKKRERGLLEKQKHCREDHDGMFARRLAVIGPGAYFCKCGAPLCEGTHVKQVEEVLAKRNAYRDTLSSQERLDASKRKPAPIKCKYCHGPILKTDYYA